MTLRNIALAALLALSPGLAAVAQSPQQQAHDHTPRIHDRAPRPHGAGATSRG